MNELFYLQVSTEQFFEAFKQITQVPIYHIFIGLVIADVVTGTIKGFVNKQANSTKGLLGILKHLMVVILVLTVTPYLVMLKQDLIADSFIIFFISQYGISFVENWGQIGLPMPEFVRQFFEKINRDKEVIKMEDVKIVVDTPKKENDI